MSPVTTARNTATEISNHSAIVLDKNAARCAMAFDLAVGRCRSCDETRVDGGPFWQELLRLADWRFSQVKEDREYFIKGILPDGIKKQMNKPQTVPGIVNESTALNHYGRGLQPYRPPRARTQSLAPARMGRAHA